ncbi:MAG TPA: agmatinase [Candidatus Bathyarchaeia archaeon]|nr:agmatinase [Candidatus Bathyarchaeia archaeon]
MRPGQQIDSFSSPRFSQVTTFARLPNIRDLTGVKSIFVGVPFDDGTTFRTGPRFGPRAVREASRMLRPYNPVVDVKPFEKLGMIDYGDVDIVPGYIEDTNRKIEETLSPIFSVGIIPAVCGGDHSITLPVLRAAAKKYGALSLIHFDAHSDCWDDYFGKKYNHGTTFKRALEEKLIDPTRSIHVGLRGPLYDNTDLTSLSKMGFSVITMKRFTELGITETLRQILEVSKGTSYVSLDIDGVDPAFAPATGTPEVGGFTSREIQELVRGLDAKNLIGFDVVEVSPPYDVAEVTALLASNLTYELCSILAKHKQL